MRRLLHQTFNSWNTFNFSVLGELKDYYTGSLRGYGVEVHVSSPLVRCLKALEVLIQAKYLDDDEKLKPRSAFMNFMKVQIRGHGSKTDTM